MTSKGWNIIFNQTISLSIITSFRFLFRCFFLLYVCVCEREWKGEKMMNEWNKKWIFVNKILTNCQIFYDRTSMALSVDCTILMVTKDFSINFLIMLSVKSRMFLSKEHDDNCYKKRNHSVITVWNILSLERKWKCTRKLSSVKMEITNVYWYLKLKNICLNWFFLWRKLNE